MICIKMARRAGRTYAPGVMPCQNGSVRVLPQREFSCSIFRSCPLKKFPGSRQRISCQQSVHGRCFSVGMNHLNFTILSFKERHHLKLPAGAVWWHMEPTNPETQVWQRRWRQKVMSCFSLSAWVLFGLSVLFSFWFQYMRVFAALSYLWLTWVRGLTLGTEKMLPNPTWHCTKCGYLSNEVLISRCS